MKTMFKALVLFCAVSVAAFSSAEQSSDQTVIVGYGPELVVNGGFETPPTSFKGDSTEDKYTLAVTNCYNWYSTTLKADTYSIPSGGCVIGVGYRGSFYNSNNTEWFSPLDPISGDYMAFMFFRGVGIDSATKNSMWCSVKLPDVGSYRWSFSARNGHTSCVGATVTAELRDGTEFEEEGEFKYELGSLTLPTASSENEDIISASGLVNVENPGLFHFCLRMTKYRTDTASTHARFCVDDVSLRPAYTTIESLFAAATADGGDVVMAKDLSLSAEDNATVPAGTSLTIDAEGHALSGTIYVNGELTLENGDFSACSFVLGENGRVNAPVLAESDIIVNGDFETPPTSVREEDVYVYTLDITRSANWYASLIKEDNFALVNGTSCSGVGYEGADDMGGYTSNGRYYTWMDALNPISGSWMAFMMDRKSADITENVIWCGVNVPAKGIYRFSFSAMNGSATSGYGAKLIAELRNGYSEISKNDGKKAYDLGYIQLSGTEGNQDKESVSGYVNIDQAGEFQFYFRQEKDPFGEYYYSYVCIDKVGLFRLYSTTEDIFKSATADGATFTLVGNATAPAAGVTLEAGKKLVLDAGGYALSGDIYVDGELTVRNGTFDGCLFNVSSGGKLVFDGITESGAAIMISGGKVVCTSEPVGIELSSGYYFKQSAKDGLWYSKKNGFSMIIR